MTFQAKRYRRTILSACPWLLVLPILLYLTGCRLFDDPADDGSTHSTANGGEPVVIVLATVPGDKEVEVPVDAPIRIRFSKPLLKTSVSVNSSDAKCRGAIMLSRDEFATCEPLGSLSLDEEDTVANLAPAALLAHDSVYKIRVGTEIAEAGGRRKPTEYRHQAGFRTVAFTPPPRKYQ